MVYLLTSSFLTYGYYGEQCGYKVVLANPQLSRQGIDNKQVYHSSAYHDDIKPIKISYDLTNTQSKSYIIKQYNPENKTQIEYPELPGIGVWMQFSSAFLVTALKKIGEPYEGEKLPKYIPASWLYWVGNSQILVQEYSQPSAHILEPINFIFLVKAPVRNKANAKIKQFLAQANYQQDKTSTNAYAGLFESNSGSIQYVPQLGKTYASTSQNMVRDHFRLLGPYSIEATDWYVYSASISQESPFYQRQLNPKNSDSGLFNCGHMYVSFNKAKNTLALNIIKIMNQNPFKNKSNVKVLGLYTIDLHNTVKFTHTEKHPFTKIPAQQIYYTGDHQLNKNTASGHTFVAIME